MITQTLYSGVTRSPRPCMQNNPVDSSSCRSLKEFAESQTLFYMQCVRPDLFGRELHDNY